MPARLRMNIMRSTAPTRLDFELWSLVVSAINGCGKCVSAHEKTLVEKGVSEEQFWPACASPPWSTPPPPHWTRWMRHNHCQ